MTFLGLLVVACAAFGHAEEKLPGFSAEMRTADQEAKYVWSLLRNISFYNSNGYELIWPQGALMESLLEKASKNELHSRDGITLRSEFGQTIYNPEDYAQGYQAVGGILATANSKVATFKAYHDKWGFYLPREYVISLTLYGPGEAYYWATGTIIMRTTKEGLFKKGRNPLETILHEAVHIGIESCVVSKYKLSQWTTERIVDQFMKQKFSDVCPNYRMQSNPETGIDTILTDGSAWDNLPEKVRQYTSQ